MSILRGMSGLRRRRAVALVAAMGALALPLYAAAATLAPSAGAASAKSAACGGTNSHPGILIGGTYASVTVTGICFVNAGQVTVTGNVNVDPGAGLGAVFAHNDVTDSGTSGITIDGNLNIGPGGSAFVGCYASSLPCLDDPNQKNPTLNSAQLVKGSIFALDSLGVVVHDTTVEGNVVELGGGGGTSCNTPTSGAFALAKSPPYSDYEDSTFLGNLAITNLDTCWTGALRDHVSGSLTFIHNIFGDPDSSEVLANRIVGNLICGGNSPANQYGDSGSTNNLVEGYAAGQCAFSVRVPNFVSPGQPSGPLAPIAVPASNPNPYSLAAADGGIFNFGYPMAGPSFVGKLPPGELDVSVTGTSEGGYIATTGQGYTQVASADTSCPSITVALNKPVVGIAEAPNGLGCYQVAADGGVFASGVGAEYYGSTGGTHLNAPVVGMAVTAGANGYFLAAADGGVFTFGPGAKFLGSMGGTHLNKPIVGIAVDPATGGYWLVASDGGVFSFGAPFYGSLGNVHLNAPIVGIAAAPHGGYYLVASDGGVFTFGPGAKYLGSEGGTHLNKPVVGIAVG